MNSVQNDFDDVGDAVRENRPLRAAREYRISVAIESVDFQPAFVSDPVPTGRQILSAAGLDDRDEITLCAILQSGDFEDIRLDETFDLRGRGAERFIAFRTDRDFKLTLDDRQLVWGMSAIEGHVLYVLSGIGLSRPSFWRFGEGQTVLLNLMIYWILLHRALSILSLLNGRVRVTPSSLTLARNRCPING